MKWEFVNGQPGRYTITNITGKTAHNVRFQAHGGFLVTMVGLRDWSETVDEIPDRQGIEFTGRKVADDARITVKWHSDPDRVDETSQITTLRP